MSAINEQQKVDKSEGGGSTSTTKYDRRKMIVVRTYQLFKPILVRCKSIGISSIRNGWHFLACFS
jgi:hypothetical protein